jgi:hypothetical protein
MALKFAVNNSLSAITTLPSSISGGALNLISTQTASASASISFTSGIDSTYDSYVFKFINIHPSVDGEKFEFNFSTDGGSNYNVTKTSTVFYAVHSEADDAAVLEYDVYSDLAQSTGFQRIQFIGNENDQSLSGTLQLFNPSSDTFVKHFMGVANDYINTDRSVNPYYAGYGNTTSAINAVQFKMGSGNIDDGIIKMYGVS